MLADSKIISIFAHMFEKEIEEYESVRKEYQQQIADKMGRQQWMEYNEILFSAHSAYISALKQIHTEGTNEHLIAFFFKTAITRMKDELSQKQKNSLPILFF